MPKRDDERAEIEALVRGEVHDAAHDADGRGAGARGDAEYGADSGADSGADGGADSGADGGADNSADGGADGDAEYGADDSAHRVADDGADGGADGGADDSADDSADSRGHRGPKPSGRVSMAMVAARAGVSGQTVSRVVNDSPRVDPGTRVRVEAVMAELGYRPHRAARALRTGRSQTLGVVAQTLATVGNSALLQAVAEAAEARGYALAVVTLGAGGRIGEAFDRLRDQGVDGAIVLNEASVLARDADPAGLALVVVDSPADHRFSVIGTDHAAGARAATAYLLDRGAATVHHLAGPEGSYAAAERERGWRSELEARGIRIPDPLRGDWSAGSGHDSGRALAADPTVAAIFAANDQMALGLLRALADARRRVPEDVAVLGFDDIADAAEFRPPLSTMRQDFAALGELAVRLVVDRVEGRDAAVPVLLVPSLVVRASA